MNCHYLQKVEIPLAKLIVDNSDVLWILHLHAMKFLINLFVNFDSSFLNFQEESICGLITYQQHDINPNTKKEK